MTTSESEVQCFMLEPTTRARTWLRRYAGPRAAKDCPFKPGWGLHEALTLLETRFIECDDRGLTNLLDRSTPPHDDLRWPTECKCGYKFFKDDEWHLLSRNVYLYPDGTETVLSEAKPGSMWYASWYNKKGLDGHSVVVKLPNGNDWLIEGKATNCDRPDDKDHLCWVRHGEAPNFTVDKNGNTCSAGAGSISSGNYHGFLRDGKLTPI